MDVISGWNTDGREKAARRAPIWKCSVASPGCGLASGETLLARLREKGKMTERGSCEMEAVFLWDSSGVNTVIGSDPRASLTLTGPFTEPLHRARHSALCFVYKKSWSPPRSSVK